LAAAHCELRRHLLFGNSPATPTATETRRSDAVVSAPTASTSTSASAAPRTPDPKGKATPNRAAKTFLDSLGLGAIHPADKRYDGKVEGRALQRGCLTFQWTV
jgi:hypothetical protein